MSWLRCRVEVRGGQDMQPLLTRSLIARVISCVSFTPCGRRPKRFLTYCKSLQCTMQSIASWICGSPNKTTTTIRCCQVRPFRFFFFRFFFSVFFSPPRLLVGYFNPAINQSLYRNTGYYHELAGNGRGSPVGWTGLIWSGFRPRLQQHSRS